MKFLLSRDRKPYSRLLGACALLTVTTAISSCGGSSSAPSSSPSLANGPKSTMSIQLARQGSASATPQRTTLSVPLQGQSIEIDAYSGQLALPAAGLSFSAGSASPVTSTCATLPSGLSSITMTASLPVGAATVVLSAFSGPCSGELGTGNLVGQVSGTGTVTAGGDIDGAFFGAATTTSSVLSLAGTQQTSTDLANPSEVRSVNGVAALTLYASINPATGTPGLEYGDAFAPPTIRVNPGDTIAITYVNRLPLSNQEPYNATNLHFHGLHVSPNPPADDAIDLLAMPGQTLHYLIPIPKDHPTGLFWYHSHAHGESEWQLFNAMSGAIVINGVDHFAKEVTGLPERVIVLRNQMAQPDFSNLQSLFQRKALAHSSRSLASIDAASSDDGICEQPWDVPTEYTTVNGHAAPVAIQMAPGGTEFWRVVNASADGYYNLSVDGQQLHLVSLDGVPMSAYLGGRESNVANVILPPASRAEFTIVGPRAGNIPFRTTCVDTGPAGDPNPSQILANISTGVASLQNLPASATSPQFGLYQEPMGAPVAQRKVVFSEDDNGNFYLNNAQYSPSSAPMFTVRSGTIERWTLENAASELHAFHIHQTHFIVQDIDGVPQPDVLRDTVSLPIAHSNGTPSVTHILIDFRDPLIRGIFLFHCHILGHEDGGMMAKVLVQ